MPSADATLSHAGALLNHGALLHYLHAVSFIQMQVAHFGDVKGVSGGVDVIMLSDQVLTIFQFQHREWLLTAPIFFLACSGKTALAASIGIDSGFPFIKIVRSVFPVPFVHCWGFGCLITWGPHAEGVIVSFDFLFSFNFARMSYLWVYLSIMKTERMLSLCLNRNWLQILHRCLLRTWLAFKSPQNVLW